MDPSLPEFSSLTEFFNQFIPNPEAFCAHPLPRISPPPRCPPAALQSMASG